VADTAGLLRLANGGTLFLDEVDSLPAKGQVLLLRLLEEPVFRPLGSEREQTFDVRVLAASNQNLDQLVLLGRFRADLLFRLRLIAIKVPPLRERDDDVELLAEHFMRVLSQRYRLQAGPLQGPVRRWLHLQPWPGNVRELEHWVCRNLLLGETAGLGLLPEDIAAPDPAGDELPLPYGAAREQALRLFDQAYLRALLGRHHGNITHAAREAGKERRALARLIKRCALDAASFRAPAP
jgi:DNA-binding NtrC family response regulator